MGQSPTTISDLLDTRQELANSITHGIGLLLTLVATPILLALGAQEGTWYQILGLGIFSFSLLAMYASSMVYHIVRTPSVKAVFRQIDHICIYLLIAGTNTPIVLYYLDNTLGHIYLTVMWLLVFIGTLYKIFFIGRMPIFSIVFYTLMGWMGVVILYFAWDSMPADTIFWMVFGGVSYTLGIIFFVWEQLPYNHAYWHLFVIGGTIGHYLGVLGIV